MVGFKSGAGGNIVEYGAAHRMVVTQKVNQFIRLGFQSQLAEHFLHDFVGFFYRISGTFADRQSVEILQLFRCDFFHFDVDEVCSAEAVMQSALGKCADSVADIGLQDNAFCAADM